MSLQRIIELQLNANGVARGLKDIQNQLRGIDTAIDGVNSNPLNLGAGMGSGGAQNAPIQRARRSLMDYEGQLSNVQRTITQTIGVQSRSEAAMLKYDTVTRKLNKSLAEGRLSQSEYNDALVQANRAYSTASQRAKEYDSQLNKMVESSGKTRGAFNAMRGGAANFSYQLQDVIVQLQMGTALGTVIAQQGPQIASIFGAGGAALGVLIALAGAFGGPLLSGMMDAGDATKNYNDEIELLSQTVSVSESGLVSFTDQFGRLAAERPEVAMSKIRTELERVSSIMNIVTADTASLFSEFGLSVYTLQSANSQLESFNGTQERLIELINQKTMLGYVDSMDAAREGVARLQEQVLGLNEGMGLVTEDSLQLVRALSDIDSPEGVISASQAVSQMAQRLQGASPELDKINIKLNEMRVRAENGQYSQEALNSILEDLQSVAGQTESATDAMTDANERATQSILSLEQQIQVQTVAMNEGQEAATRLSAELALGENVSEELRQKVGDLAVEYYNLTEAQKNAQAQQRALAVEQAQAEREQEQLNQRAQSAVDRAIMQSMDREDQILAEAAATIALINASTDLNDVQKELAGIQVAENAKKEIADGAEKAIEDIPSDFAMSVGEALASQDFSSFANILASQAASSIGTAVTDAIGGSLGGVAGGLIGGAAGAVISQAISNYMADDLIALERQASQGTGTVLGSIDAKSQSIANSLDYMSEGLDDLIGVNTEGFKAMQALVDSIGGASGIIARDFDASGIAANLGLSSLGGITQDFGGIVDDFFGGLTGGLFENVFGSIGGALFGSSSVSDQGISLLSGTIAELIENDVTQAYQTVTKKSLFGSSRSESYRFAGDAIEQQFDLTLEAMRDAVTISAESLGMLPSEIQANLDAFTIEAQKISIKDLSADEVAEELEAVFSSIFDNLASAVVPYVSDFQEAGEGAGETLSRLSTNLAVVDEMLSQLRLNDLQGATQEMLTISEGVVDLFGDASGLATAFTGFIDEFATEERQLEILTEGLTRALGEQDSAILRNRDGVYEYIQALDISNESEARRLANILNLTDSMEEFFDLVDSVLQGNTDTAFSVLSRSISAERQRLTNAYEDNVDAINKSTEGFKDVISGLTGLSNSLEQSIGSSRVNTQELNFARLQASRVALARAAMNGTVPTDGSLDRFITEVSGDNERFYSDFESYAIAQAAQANDLKQLKELADDQLDEVKSAEEYAQEQLDILQMQYELDLEALDAQLEFAQEQLDIARDSFVELQDISSAMDAFLAALGAEINNTLPSAGVSSSEISQAYNYLQQQNTTGGVTDWDAADYQAGLAAINAGVSSEQLAESLGVSANYVQQRAAELGLPAFANGGFHSGGMRLVGERGAEMELTGPSRIFSANQTSNIVGGAMVGSAEVLSELKYTNQLLRDLNVKMIESNDNTGLLETFAINGLAVNATIVADKTV